MPRLGRAGRAYLHTVNRDHIATPIAELLAGLRSEVLRRLRAAIAAWDPAPVHASMFGSAARGDGDANSDIDLFIIRPADVEEEDAAWRSQLDALTNAVYSWTGNHASVVELGEDELDRLRRDELPVLTELRADAVDLAGTPVRELLGAG